MGDHPGFSATNPCHTTNVFQPTVPTVSPPTKKSVNNSL